MIFEEGASVIYKGMNGVVDFICGKYVVIQVDAKPNQTPARLIVYRDNYSNITLYEK
jgi:hypothetical protein